MVKLQKDIGKIANYVSFNRESALEVLSKIQELFTCFVCQDLIRDEMPFTVHCCHQLCCKICLETWRAQSALNGRPHCKHNSPTHVPLIFAGSSEFLTQLRRVPYLSNIAGRVKKTTATASPTLLDDSLNDIDI